MIHIHIYIYTYTWCIPILYMYIMRMYSLFRPRLEFVLSGMLLPSTKPFPKALGFSRALMAQSIAQRVEVRRSSGIFFLGGRSKLRIRVEVGKFKVWTCGWHFFCWFFSFLKTKNFDTFFFFWVMFCLFLKVCFFLVGVWFFTVVVESYFAQRKSWVNFVDKISNPQIRCKFYICKWYNI